MSRRTTRKTPCPKSGIRRYVGKGGANGNNRTAKRRVVFAPNTKGGPGVPNNSALNVSFPTNQNQSRASQYLQQMYDSQIQIPSTEMHEENAHVYGQVVGSLNDPQEMQRELFRKYQPVDLTKQDYGLLINIVAMAPMPEEQRHRILMNLRYRKLIQKLQKQYGNYVPTPATTTATPAKPPTPPTILRPVAMPAQKMSPMPM